MQDLETRRPGEEDITAQPTVDNFTDKVEFPALTTTHLYKAASTFLETNPDMSPADREKYFMQMAEYVAKQLKDGKIY